MMERENRYLVLKKHDLDMALSVVDPEVKRGFERVVEAVEILRKFREAQPLDCVVVESDWPEYEPTWQAIEKRVDGA